MGVYLVRRVFFWALGGGARATGAPRGRFGDFGPVGDMGASPTSALPAECFPGGLLAFSLRTIHLLIPLNAN